MDVATDYAGKCTLIALALTLIERSLLPDRPAFWITAGRRGGGKTTTFKMLIMAVTGSQAAAAAWSTNEEERRKALFGYLLAGVPYILWDNIPRGSQISCPHIEKSCTSAYYTDRRLGVSETVTTAAATIQLFTGNNVGPRGDLASRSLRGRLNVDRPDPENREFKHPDPIAWTERNRAEILQALYTILLGNPTLKQPSDSASATRFKGWHRLVGSALEYAARLVSQDVEPTTAFYRWNELDFQKLFLTQEAEGDEDSSALAEALEVMARRWGECKAADVADLINRIWADSNLDDETVREMKRDSVVLRDFLFGHVNEKNFVATPKSVSQLLSAYVDNPVEYGEGTLTLRARPVHKVLRYIVVRT